MLDDHERLKTLMAALTSDGEPQVLTVDGEPRSKARPKRGKNGTVYVDTKDRAVADGLTLQLRSLMPRPLDGNIAVACIFYRSSAHRIDTDNLLKQVLDCANKVCWHDDSQVTAVLGVLEMDRANPRTVMGLAEHSSSMRRGEAALISECQGCGKPFSWRPYPSLPERAYCSRACATDARTYLTAMANCRQCGEPFRRRVAAQSLCSEECRRAWWSEERRAARARPEGRCEECGTKVSRPEYRRCRKCWRGGAQETLALTG